LRYGNLNSSQTTRNENRTKKYDYNNSAYLLSSTMLGVHMYSTGIRISVRPPKLSGFQLSCGSFHIYAQDVQLYVEEKCCVISWNFFRPEICKYIAKYLKKFTIFK